MTSTGVNMSHHRHHHASRRVSSRTPGTTSATLTATLGLVLLAGFSRSSGSGGSGGGGGAHGCSAFLMPSAAPGRHRHDAGRATKREQGPNTRRRRSSMPLQALGGDGGLEGSGLRGGLAKQEFKTMLQEGSTKGCLKIMQRTGSQLELELSDGCKLLTLLGQELLQKPRPNDESITEAYTALKTTGLLKGFGSIDLDVVPSKSRTISPEKLVELTGMEVRNLAPGRPTGSWAAAGAVLFGAECLAGQILGVDPLQTIVPATLGLFIADRVIVGGAVAETCTRALVPGYRERIIRHEAGHFLLAYLLGCPVQGCLLDPFTVGKFALSGAQGGTVFADPIFARGMASGQLKRSSIDRFTIVVMAGIAAEAIQYGNSEGGASDEGAMIEILSTISPPFNLEQIKSQALWSATQAVLLINEHKEAYDELVVALDRGDDLGECVRVIENVLAKKPLPGDVRRASIKPASPADEVKGMVMRRMSQRYWSQQEEERRVRTAPKETVDAVKAGLSLASDLAENDRAMLDLQRRVEDLERTITAGNSIQAQGLKDDTGGVWMNDLKALREDIVSTNEKNKIANALDAVLSEEPASSPSPSSSTSSTPSTASSTATATSSSAAATAAPSSSSSVSSPIGTPSAAVSTTLLSAAVAKQTKEAEQLKDIEAKTAENAKRMAEVEARLRKFEEKHAQ